MLKMRVLRYLMAGLPLLVPGVAAAQEVTCQSLSDDEAKKFVTEPGQVLVSRSGLTCKTGETVVQIRFQIIEYTARYDCEIRVMGEKAFCWRLS